MNKGNKGYKTFSMNFQFIRNFEVSCMFWLLNSYTCLDFHREQTACHCDRYIGIDETQVV